MRRSIVLLTLPLLAACGSFGVNAKRGSTHKFRVPAGVDSTVAREADSLQSALFIDHKTEKKVNALKNRAMDRLQRSDSLWARLKQAAGAGRVDSSAARELLERGKQRLARIPKKSSAEKAKNILSGETYKKINVYLNEAAAAFEKAILLNPYDLQARSWLSRVYSLRAERFERKNDYRRAAMELENLLQLDKGNHDIYYRLAVNYFNMKSWKVAYDIFLEAERVLKETAFMTVDTPDANLDDLNNVPVDSSVLFYYRYYQGVAQSRLYNAGKALEILRSAVKLANNDEDRRTVEAYIDWINWDGGNIRGSEVRDSLIVLQNDGKIKEATTGLLNLARHLRTQRAQDEIIWRAAVLEYQKLEKKEEAVDRMHALVKRTRDRLGEEPADSAYQRYFEDYATMCYNLGLDNTQRRKWQDAYAYFLQASRIDWKGRAKSNVEIAKIVQNNPDLVIKHCRQALEHSGTLTSLEKRDLYQLLSIAYLKKGMASLAKEARLNLLRLRRATGSGG